MKKKALIHLLVLYVISNASLVFADGLDSISGSSLETGVGKIIKWVAGIFALIYGAFGFIQAGIAFTQGEEGVAIKKFKSTAIGVVVILACWAIANYVIKFIQ